MSRILRRPMFRGGKVIDSRGTGITSGLMDTPSYATGGRVGFSNGGSFFDIFKGADTRGYNNMILGGELYPQSNTTTDILGMKDYLGTSRNILDQQKPVKIGTDEDIVQKTTEEIFAESKAKKDSDAAKAKEMGVDVDTMKAIERENLSTSGVSDAEKEKAILTQPDLSKSTGEVKTEISAKDLIRENAELFKELLNEGNKEKIKEARIQDLSDLGLDIFAKSQQEGATVGSTLGGAAASLVGKDSRVDKAKAAIEKGDQTAVALAINDYIAGKRSKESTDQLIAKLKLSAKLKEGSIGDQILAVAARQTLTGGKIKEILGVAVGDGEAKGIRTIPSGQENAYEPGPEDEGFFFFEEGTKNVFKYEDGVLKPIYAPN